MFFFFESKSYCCYNEPQQQHFVLQNFCSWNVSLLSSLWILSKVNQSQSGQSRQVLIDLVLFYFFGLESIKNQLNGFINWFTMWLIQMQCNGLTVEWIHHRKSDEPYHESHEFIIEFQFFIESN